jgi:Putative MetA-pathway of phenol degradation
MRSPVGNGSPKSWWTLQLRERAGHSSRSGLVLGVLMLALPGCMTTGHQSAKSLDSSVRSAPPRGALNDRPTNQRATPPGLLENPVVRGQDPGADQEGGPQDAGSAAVVAPAGSAPPLPQPNPPAPVPPADNLASAPPDFALDPVANPVGATPAASPGGALASAAAGRPLANPANPQINGLSSIARNRVQRELAPGTEPEFNYPDIHADPAKIYHDRFGIDEEHDRFLFPWLMNLIFEDRWLLAERDVTKATQNQFRHRMKIDIRDPDPDTANFPSGAYTLPKGRMYIENSPASFYGPSTITPPQYNWQYLLRYGLTDNLELRLFSNGLTATKGKGATTGVSPLAFDFKINFWEENTRYWIPAMGVEIYIQTTFGSPAFNSGTQPSTALLFDHTLPLGFSYEHNFGLTGNQGPLKLNVYQFSYQWSLQHQVVKDFDVFWQGFYNATALPQLRRFDLPELDRARTRNPIAVVTGVGGIWTVNDRLAIYGSYNFGLTKDSPTTMAFLGFAVAF